MINFCHGGLANLSELWNRILSLGAGSRDRPIAAQVGRRVPNIYYE
jgi:hypothetical protein